MDTLVSDVGLWQLPPVRLLKVGGSPKLRPTAQHGSWVISSSTTKVTGWPAVGAAGSMCIRTLTPSPALDQDDPVGIVEVGIGGAPGGGNFRGGAVPVGSGGPGGQRVVDAVALTTVVTVLAGVRTVV